MNKEYCVFCGKLMGNSNEEYHFAVDKTTSMFFPVHKRHNKNKLVRLYNHYTGERL